jgi:hypothetical protein
MSPPLEGEAAGSAVEIEPVSPLVVETAPAQAESPLPVANVPVPSRAQAAASFDAPRLSGFYAELAPGRGELRLDVDGPYPLLKVSGVVSQGLADRLHWIANVAPVSGAPAERWSGSIWYKNGTTALLPHASVEVTLRQGGGQREAVVRFFDGAAPKTRIYRRKSAYFHPVEFEFDIVEGSTAVTSIETGAHPNRPAELPSETLTIEAVYRRAGFDVTLASSGSVPLNAAGTDGLWSETEMHDAMQTYWSRFAGAAQWSLWVLFAARHEDTPDGPGFNLGGIMFDDIGPNHRQGTAIFNDSFISRAPAGDAAPAAWVRRMQFWTACHEMGHAFNLAHSWDKSLNPSWIPLADEVEARSFMNYPYEVSGGQTAFFSDFAYRFSEQELIFMRHAPERFVQMGNALWFDNHAFRQAEISPEPKLRLDLRVNRDKPTFEFLEPCMIELKLTNISDGPLLVGRNVLTDAEHLVVIVKRDDHPAKRWLPFAQYCWKTTDTVLERGASRYQALFVGSGRSGWLLAEPGWYTVQVALRHAGEELVSNRLRLKIVPPRSRDEEYLAQDMFTEDVGRVLAFDGSRVLDDANDVLRDVADRLPDQPVARHALIALNRPLMREGKVLRLPDRKEVRMESAVRAGGRITLSTSDPDAARSALNHALFSQPALAARTLGHIEYKQYCDSFSDRLAEYGDNEGASDVQEKLLTTLRERNVAPSVLQQVEAKQASFAGARGSKRARAPK